MKILIVEDSKLMRRAITKVVVAKGYDPIEAVNGAEALERLQENKPDVGLVIMDWNMPIMDGFEALVKIREDEQYNNVQVLMATSEGIQEDITRATQAGANGYMVKPFTLQQLADKIKELVED